MRVGVFQTSSSRESDFWLICGLDQYLRLAVEINIDFEKCQNHLGFMENIND